MRYLPNSIMLAFGGSLERGECPHLWGKRRVLPAQHRLERSVIEEGGFGRHHRLLFGRMSSVATRFMSPSSIALPGLCETFPLEVLSSQNVFVYIPRSVVEDGGGVVKFVTDEQRRTFSFRQRKMRVGKRPKCGNKP